MSKTILDELTEKIIGAAICVHRALGPGLLESAYEQCLLFELRSMGLRIEQQRPVPVIYREVRLECGYRLDLVVEDRVIVEIKAIEKLHPIHSSQALSYLRLTRLPVALLLNFHVNLLKDGVIRVVNNYPESI